MTKLGLTPEEVCVLAAKSDTEDIDELPSWNEVSVKFKVYYNKLSETPIENIKEVMRQEHPSKLYNDNFPAFFEWMNEFYKNIHTQVFNKNIKNYID